MFERISKFLFRLSIGAFILSVVFAYGIAVGLNRVWPGEHVADVYHNLRSLMKFGEFVPRNRRIRLDHLAEHERVEIPEPERAIAEGYFAHLGWDDTAGSYAVWLHGADGALLHRWPVDETGFSEAAQTNSNAPHALQVLRDGSILVNMDRLGGIYRLDACGDAIWAQEAHYHHSFFPSARGGVWTWAGRGHVDDELQYLVRFDTETGAELERIGLVEDVLTPDANRLVLASLLPGHEFAATPDRSTDIFHANDIEELLPALAPAFPMFEAGDLLLSLRNLNLLMVISPEGAVKWARYGPWFQQHDPDFNADGTITVFDNNRGRSLSRVLQFRPDRPVVETWAWPTPEFSSAFRGKHQILPNGALLLTIPESGRALEIAPDGTVLREYNNKSEFGPNYLEDLVNSVWLPPDHFDQLPTCEN